MTAYLNALGIICALGRGQQQVRRNLFAGDCSGMRAESGWVPERVLPVGSVPGELAPLPLAYIHVIEGATGGPREVEGRPVDYAALAAKSHAARRANAEAKKPA